MFAIGPDRIALYSYAHVTWLAKQQRGFERKDLPEPATKLAIMLTAIRRFLAQGYLFIGLDHFARPDDELARALADRTLRRNFMGHTTQAGVDLIGFGPSAISELRASYAQSFRDEPDWRQAVARARARDDARPPPHARRSGAALDHRPDPVPRRAARRRVPTTRSGASFAERLRSRAARRSSRPSGDRPDLRTRTAASR